MRQCRCIAAHYQNYRHLLVKQAINGKLRTRVDRSLELTQQETWRYLHFVHQINGTCTWTPRFVECHVTIVCVRGVLLCVAWQEYDTKTELHRHAKEVHGLEEKSHKCGHCFKSFPSSQQLTQHTLVHSNVRKYQCKFCDKTFKQLSHVQQHQRIHTGKWSAHSHW